jgi:hypothetical protein
MLGLAVAAALAIMAPAIRKSYGYHTVTVQGYAKQHMSANARFFHAKSIEKF